MTEIVGEDLFDQHIITKASEMADLEVPPTMISSHRITSKAVKAGMKRVFPRLGLLEDLHLYWVNV